MNIPSIDQLKKALHLGERIETLQKELAAIFGSAGTKALNLAASGMNAATKGILAIKIPRTKPKFSKASRAKIAAAQKARWAKVKGTKTESKPAAKEKPVKRKKGKMSAAGRANIVAAQKARWAKVKAEKRGKKA